MNSPIVTVVIGGLAVVGGIFALLNPLAATFTAERIAAWFFMIVGVLQIVSVFGGDGGMGTRILNVLIGIVSLIIGFSLFTNPLAGVLSLTLMVAFLFLAGGVSKIVLAFFAGISKFWLVALSGAISIVLAGMIFSNFPASAASILGVLLAIELISSGVSLISFGVAKREVPA